MLRALALTLIVPGLVACDNAVVSPDGGAPPPPMSDAGAGPRDAGEPVDGGGAEVGRARWVGVGAWGFRASTGDGASWVSTLNPEQANDHSPDLLRDVSYGDGVFIAVGGDANAMIMRSTDGVTWAEDLHPAGTQWKGGVAYGDGRWIAVGGNGSTLYSDDAGLSWTEGPSRLPAAGRNVAWGNGRFVAVGDSGMIASSTDALTWTDRSVGGLRLDRLAYGLGRWVTTGSQWNGSGFDNICLESADDAETWRECSFTASRFDAVLATGGSLIVTLGEGYEIYDGTSWRRIDTPVPGRVFEADGTWVGVGGSRRSYGPSLDALTAADEAERSFRSFTVGWVRD